MLLIEAAKQLIAGGIDVDIVLAGDGPMRTDIEALIERHGLAARVRITGWLDAQCIQNELRQARALVLSSLSEGLPVVIMEAMANRLPVIAPYLAGIPELVTHGETGWLYPVSDVEALAQAMRTCLGESTELLTRMGDVARERVAAAHDVDAEAHRLIKLFSAHD